MRDEQQEGIRNDIMETMDNLLVTRYMLEEVKEHLRTAAAAYNNYQKAYDKVSHEWQIDYAMAQFSFQLNKHHAKSIQH